IDRISADRGEGARPHSPFAEALIEGLNGAADLTNDALITASELAVYLRHKIEPIAKTFGRAQTPQLHFLNKHEHGEFLFKVPGPTLELGSAPVVTARNSPYLGLSAFEEKDAALFFGREELVASLLTKIETHQLVVVVGPSGAGKSSLVQAGLFPSLRH